MDSVRRQALGACGSRSVELPLVSSCVLARSQTRKKTAAAAKTDKTALSMVGKISGGVQPCAIVWVRSESRLAKHVAIFSTGFWVQNSYFFLPIFSTSVALLRTHIVQYPDAPGEFRDSQHQFVLGKRKLDRGYVRRHH